MPGRALKLEKTLKTRTIKKKQYMPGRALKQEGLAYCPAHIVKQYMPGRALKLVILIHTIKSLEAIHAREGIETLMEAVRSN